MDFLERSGSDGCERLDRGEGVRTRADVRRSSNGSSGREVEMRDEVDELVGGGSNATQCICLSA